MDPILLAVLGIAVMFGLIGLHVPIGMAMAATGFCGVGILLNWEIAASLFTSVPTELISSDNLAAIPMFLMMGSFAAAAGLSQELYRLFAAMMGHLRGGLAMATIFGCGGFGAVCGSSLATASTFMRVALPEMRRRGYRDDLATGCIAGGGTLGILIPPSNLLILYGILTQQFIIALFIAAIIPGLITIALYLVTIFIYVRMRPGSGPSAPRVPMKERFKVVLQSWRVVLLASVISGGIYGGIFTVLEAAAVGAALAFLFTFQSGNLNLQVFRRAMSETASTTVMIFVIIIGANIFSSFITLTQLPTFLVDAITEMQLPSYLVILVLLALYLILGSIFDTVAAMVITLPVVFPLIVGLGFDPIWWGIINIMVIEIGMITPPIGVVVYILHGMAPDVPLKTIFSGIIPFFITDLVRLAILVAFPALTLWLPGLLGLTSF